MYLDDIDNLVGYGIIRQNFVDESKRKQIRAQKKCVLCEYHSNYIYVAASLRCVGATKYQITF